MPEIWTKHPDLVKRILEEAGFRCNIEEKRILVNCATERFCAFESSKIYGEICIHDFPRFAFTEFLILMLCVIAVILVIFLIKKKRIFK